MNKVIIFDWGGVVESHENDYEDLKNARMRMFKKLNNSITEEKVLNIWADKIPKGISMGATNDEKDIKDWAKYIMTSMGIINTSVDAFKQLYEDEMFTVKYYKDVVEYAHSLKDKCKIGILSNLMSFDKKRINDQCDLSKFDYVYLSFEIGMLKPNKEVYEYVLNDLKIDASNILFIDDNKDNIEMAKACGWNTCMAFGYELDKIKNSVNKFLNEN